MSVVRIIVNGQQSRTKIEAKNTLNQLPADVSCVLEHLLRFIKQLEQEQQDVNSATSSPVIFALRELFFKRLLAECTRKRIKIGYNRFIPSLPGFQPLTPPKSSSKKVYKMSKSANSQTLVTTTNKWPVMGPGTERHLMEFLNAIYKAL